MGNESDIVMFLDASGNEVSNDPRWIAKQQIRRFEDTVSDPEGDGGMVAYEDRSAKWLKEEVKRRREAGRELDTKGVTKSAQLVDLLTADDEAVKQEALAAAAGEDNEDEESEESEENE